MFPIQNLPSPFEMSENEREEYFSALVEQIGFTREYWQENFERYAAEQHKIFGNETNTSNSARTHSIDQIILDSFSLDDLDLDSLLRFRTLLSLNHYFVNGLQYPLEVFLVNIGAAARDIKSEIFSLRVGTVFF